MGLKFDKTRDGVHNIIRCFHFAVHLHQKQASEFTGQEPYVRDKLSAQDLEFLPINRCSVLGKARAKHQRVGADASDHRNTLAIPRQMWQNFRRSQSSTIWAAIPNAYLRYLAVYMNLWAL
eukprot:COSAG02_NODE_6370_length_3619_cov_86.835227_3_plen_121_part_00